MSRAELVRLLNILVAARQITAEQAAQVLELFDTGQLSADALPLALSEIAAVSDDDHNAALLIVAALLGSVYASRLLAGRPGIPLALRTRVRDALRLAFEVRAARLATKLIRSGDVSEWHRDMATVVQDHVLQQAILGAARPLRANELAAVRDTVREQAGFLYRFAGRVAVGLAIGAALTVAYVASRAALYAGAGWEWFWRGNESGVSENGIVSVYRARDDGSTCTRCISAALNSPYLPGEGPMPGDVCLGSGRCRCTRELVYDLDAWRRLTGRRAA